MTVTGRYARVRPGINLALPAGYRAGSGDDYSPNIEFWLHLLAPNLRFRRARIYGTSVMFVTGHFFSATQTPLWRMLCSLCTIKFMNNVYTENNVENPYTYICICM